MTTIYTNGFASIHRSEKCAKRDGRISGLIHTIELNLIDPNRHRICKVCMKADLADFRNQK